MNTFNPFSAAESGAKRLTSVVGDSMALAQRADATARNAAEWIRYGGLNVDEEYSPYEVMATGRNYRVRRYFPADAPAGLPPLIFVPPLMIKADVYDIAPRSSPVRAAHDNGIDVWVVDFGDPDDEPGGLDRTVADHVVALSEVVDHVRRITGQNVVLSGYSQGGLFSYLTTAYRRNDGVDSIVTFGAVVDFQSGAPLPVPVSPESFEKLAQDVLDLGVFRHISMPAWANRTITKAIDPIKSAEFYVNYFAQLHDREKLMRGEKQRQFLDQNGWAAYPGPALEDLLQYVAHNRLLTGGLVVDDRTVALSDIEVPIFIAVGERDAQGPPRGVRAIREAAPRADVYELTLNTGHFGIIASSGARKWTWPRVAAWIRWRVGQGEFPEGLVPADQVTSTRAWSPGRRGQQVRSAMDLGVGLSRTTARTLTGAAGLARSVVKEGGRQIPILNRLDALRPATAISLGLMLDEAARARPDGIALLYGDRVIRQRELKHRIDSVVKGLVAIGVRQGDRVGVLMSARPSGFAAVAAINRLGAVAVLLRPDGALDVESRLGEISFLIVDPDHVTARPPAGVTRAVLGDPDGERAVPPGVVDLERIDPDKVALPAWYRANPRRGSDVAFVMFTGEGARTSTRVISNRRWALSALGTASAAALKPSDTVYSVTPLHHPSALLMAAGGAIAAGSRLALASASDRATFWTEVRRYGATHVSYTWTSLREIASGPEHPMEKGSPIRLFLGSGMPANLWRRVTERFAPAKVLEFYASADGEAILANVAGTKIGAVGRPLPGTAEVRVAGYDTARRQLLTGADGLALECRPGETGLLLARFDPASPADHLRRGVFDADDAWQSTGDLFTRDADGDLWLVDPVDSLIRCAAGMVSPSRVRSALGRVPEVDLAVAYGVPDGDTEVLVAAVTLFPGADLGAWELENALAVLPADHRPQIVRVVKEIPVSTWGRPLVGPLRDAGLPQPEPSGEVWRLAPDGRSYRSDADSFGADPGTEPSVEPVSDPSDAAT